MLEYSWARKGMQSQLGEASIGIVRKVPPGGNKDKLR
jgi:hypothetical protein